MRLLEPAEKCPPALLLPSLKSSQYLPYSSASRSIAPRIWAFFSRFALLSLLLLFLPIIAYAAQVNINTADAGLLDTLPGIGPSKAAAIVDYRTQHGPFARVEDIQGVKGIGPATFANMKDSITVGATASVAPQPSADTASYKKVQTVESEPVKKESITSAPNIPTHEEAVIAPAAANDLAIAGASLPATTLPANARASGLFSVWTFGLLGVILVAGGAFILI